MEENLLTAGQFAKLARTTKRTIIWYTEKGILEPYKTSESGYRLYKPSQILDFQVILLLRRLHFSLKEIKSYLDKNNTFKDLFKLKQSVIRQEIKDLQKALDDLNNYYNSLETNETLIKPIIKEVKSFSIYYLDKVGPYAKIKDYCVELKSYFDKISARAIYLTLFEEGEYKPNKAKMKIGVVIENRMIVKDDKKTLVKQMFIPSYKALSYLYKGPGSLLSLLWQELAKYRNKNGYKLNRALPFFDLEFYHKTSLNTPMDENDMIFEIQLPIL